VRIRIKGKPDSREIAEFDARTFVVGETIEVPARLATLLIVGGYAEPEIERWKAADADTITHRKKP
jgi:hypothetical protein